LSVLFVWTLCLPQSALSAEKKGASYREAVEESTRKNAKGDMSAALQPSWWNRPVDYFSDSFPRHLIQGTREALTLENLIVFGLAGAATGALLTVDDEIVDYFRDERPMGQTAQDAGSTLGSPQMLFGLAGATYLVGEFSKNSRIRTTGETALESLALTGLTTILLKVSTQRERPDGSNNLSFPSLHAAGSFAVAASLHEGYGFRVSVPAFLTAGFISLARVQEQKHFLSDTLFGAALGTVIGLAMGRVHRQSWSRHIQVAPLAGEDQLGLQISLSSGLFR
jgi:hypothetical protein